MELWVGLVELRANPDCKDSRRFGDGKGAFVWVAAWADSQITFETKVTVMSEGLDCIMYGFENVGLMEDTMETEGYPDEFINLRATAIRQPLDTVFGPFHIWSQEDRN